MRIALPVHLIREMDAVVLEGIGGYATRAEFIVDAIQERILELTIPVDEEAETPRNQFMSLEVSGEKHDASAVPRAPSSRERDDLIAQTRISAPSRGFILNETRLGVSRGHLFGLHNRDYPSIWALAQLAAFAREHAVPIGDFFHHVVQEAWGFGTVLLDIENRIGLKSTALFPTNPEKRKAAEAAFLTFAVGGYRSEDGSMPTMDGPLFGWGVAGVSGAPDLQIGVTAAGWDLLSEMDGITVEEPHPQAAARQFFGHLAKYGMSDYATFAEILTFIDEDGSTRQELLAHVAHVWPDWTENEVSTNTAGYVARAREWGLLEPKHISNRYQLAPLGHELLAESITEGRT